MIVVPTKVTPLRAETPAGQPHGVHRRGQIESQRCLGRKAPSPREKNPSISPSDCWNHALVRKICRDLAIPEPQIRASLPDRGILLMAASRIRAPERVKPFSS